MKKLLIITLALAVFLPTTAFAKTFDVNIAPTLGLRIGTIQMVLGAKGEWVVIPLDKMMGLELTTEFSIGEGDPILNIGFHPKFRYPINEFTPYAGIGFSIVHVFGLPEPADSTGSAFDLLGGFEWAFKHKMSFMGQIEGHIGTGDFVDLEVGLVFHL